MLPADLRICVSGTGIIHIKHEGNHVRIITSPCHDPR